MNETLPRVGATLLTPRKTAPATSGNDCVIKLPAHNARTRKMAKSKNAQRMRDAYTNPRTRKASSISAKSCCRVNSIFSSLSAASGISSATIGLPGSN